jgi:hypothetical protein
MGAPWLDTFQQAGPIQGCLSPRAAQGAEVAAWWGKGDAHNPVPGKEEPQYNQERIYMRMKTRQLLWLFLTLLL